MTSRQFFQRAATLGLGTCFFLTIGFTQQRGQTPAPTPTPPTGNPGGNIPPTGPPGGTPGQPGNPSRTQMPQPGQDQRNPFPDMGQRPIFLSGKVATDDGTPPPDSVVIELVCNGLPRPQAYTDSKGRFSFQVGQNQAVMQDASVSSASDGGFGTGGGGFGQQRPGAGANPGGSMANPRVSERDLMACDLRAALPGYRSEMVNLSGRRSFDNPDVGTILLHRLGNVEGQTISMTTLQAPKDAKKAYDKGREAFRKKKYGDAQKDLEKAVASYPKFAAAWFELGRVQQEQKQVAEARDSYSKALQADPKFMSPYLELAVLSARENKWQEVADTTDRLIRLDPFDYPQAYFFNSVANYNLKKLDAAEKSAREAQKLDTAHRIPKVDHLLGVILAQKQDYSGAAEQMRNYLRFAPAAQDADQVKNQLIELEKLTGNVKPKQQQ